MLGERDGQNIDVFQLALPQHEDAIAQLTETSRRYRITLDVPTNLVRPKGCSCRWKAGSGTAFVPVPKAAVNRDYRAVLFQNYIRRAGQRTLMNSKSVAQSMKQASDFDFRLGVFAWYASHLSAALIG